MPLGYSSPGAAFGSGFEDYLMQQQQQKHQQMLEDLAMKREQRLAQAELDSAAERQDALAAKKAKDLEDAHQKKVADFEKRTSQMVKGDRPDPEMVQQDQALGTHIFRIAPPAMSTAAMQPPAALMEAPPAGAPAEGAEVPTPEGAMAPGPVTYPGSAAERQKEIQKAQMDAFVQRLRDSGETDKAQEVANAYEAESLGLKTPAGMFSKTAGSEVQPVYRQNPRTGSIEKVGEVPKGAHFMTEPAPKDTSAADARQAAAVSRMYEHGVKDFDTATKPVLETLSNLRKMATSLSQGTNIADSTLAEQLIKITAGGAGSGVRITNPEIEQVLKKSRTGWDNLTMALNRWVGASDKDKQNPLFFSDEQKAGMREIIKAFKESATSQRDKILKLRDELDEATDEGTIKKIRTRLARELSEDTISDIDAKTSGSGPTGAPAAAKPKRTAEQILKDAEL